MRRRRRLRIDLRPARGRLFRLGVTGEAHVDIFESLGSLPLRVGDACPPIALGYGHVGGEWRQQCAREEAPGEDDVDLGAENCHDRRDIQNRDETQDRERKSCSCRWPWRLLG